MNESIAIDREEDPSGLQESFLGKKVKMFTKRLSDLGICE